MDPMDFLGGAGEEEANVLTKYEFSRILGLRVGQLNLGATPLVLPCLEEKKEEGKTNLQIACREIKEGKLDMMIRRPCPEGTFYSLPLSSLLLPPDVDELLSCFRA